MRYVATIAPLALTLASCALTAPPRNAPPTTTATLTGPAVSIIEGQPRGLVLQFETANQPGAQSVLLRRTVGDEAFTLRHTFKEDGVVRFLDGDVTHGVAYEYAAALLIDGKPKLSPPVSAVRWTTPPAPPSSVEATALGRHVEIAWQPRTGFGAVIFRRELRGGGYTRLLMVVPPTEALRVDAPPKRGEVYAYMVCHVALSGNVHIIGSPSAEVYVETMPEGRLSPEPPGPLSPPAPHTDSASSEGNGPPQQTPK